MFGPVICQPPPTPSLTSLRLLPESERSLSVSAPGPTEEAELESSGFKGEQKTKILMHELALMD